MAADAPWVEVATGPRTLVEGPTSLDRPVVEVASLHKAYGATVVVEDVSFTVAEGEIFGILGPNRAGKNDDR